MRCLVTGGAGFIGSHLCELLLAEGHQVRVLDNLSSGFRKNIEGMNLEFHEADIRDARAVARAADGVDVVFHLAAFISVPESVEKPEECFSVNLEGFESLLKESQRAKVKQVLFSSSCAVYGDTDGFPKTENSAVKPMSPYAESKLQGEQLLQQYCDEADDMTGTSFRYFNVFGERQDPTSFYAAVIAKFIDNAKSDKPLTIYGDGGTTRDFIYVKDVARANFHMMQNPESGLFQVGSGVETSVLQLAKLILELTGSASQLEFKEERRGDLRRSVGDIAKLLATGWPGARSLRDGIEQMLAAEA